MATIRKFPLVKGEVYHIFNKSIAGYNIFNNEEEFLRIKETISYYQWGIRKTKFSRRRKTEEKDIVKLSPRKDKLVDIIAYCIMSTHIHLILKQLKEKGISIFMSQISNSYARYFNVKYKRKGPLWEREFQNVLVSTDEQLLHLTRYIHLNPVTAFLVNKPEDWPFSSYKEYLEQADKDKKICSFKELLDIDPTSYKKFVDDRISYQRDLEKIKHLILE